MSLRGPLVAALCMVGASARADGRPSRLRDYGKHALPGAAQLEVGGSAKNGLHAMTFVLAGRYAASTTLDLHLEVPTGLIGGSLVSQAHRGFFGGNPLVGVRYTDRERDGESYLSVGAGLSLPITSVYDTGRFGTGDTGLLLAMNGGTTPWYFIRDLLGLVCPIRAESRRGMRVLGVELTIALWPRALGVQFQLAPWVGIDLGDVLLGMRLQGVWWPVANDDTAAVSAVPFIQVELGEHAFAYTRFVLNIDEPLGFIGDGANTWGAFLGAGAHF